jgi:hypothetical protein
MIFAEEKAVGVFPLSRKALVVLFFMVMSLARGMVFGQFKPEEIARRGEMETFLVTAEIVKFEPAGEGVTKPIRLYLRKGDIESQAFWKNPSGMLGGFQEGWQYEIAAYRLDKLIGLNMVPVAVEREFQGKKGALSLRAENKFSLLKVEDEKIPIPQEARERVDKMKWLTRAWDSLIGNEDRTQQNVLFTEDWRTILIDHSRAFRSGKKFSEKLMYGAQGIKTFRDGRPVLFRRLPRWFAERLKGLTYESVAAAVGSTLTEEEIRSVLARRDLLLKEIDDQIRQLGEANVLYD